MRTLPVHVDLEVTPCACCVAVDLGPLIAVHVLDRGKRLEGPANRILDVVQTVGAPGRAIVGDDVGQEHIVEIIVLTRVDRIRVAVLEVADELFVNECLGVHIFFSLRNRTQIRYSRVNVVLSH